MRNDFTEDEISKYLDYISLHSIIISKYINENEVGDKKIIIQHINEISESYKSIINILGDNISFDDLDSIEVFRDFKINQIINERD